MFKGLSQTWLFNFITIIQKAETWKGEFNKKRGILNSTTQHCIQFCCGVEVKKTFVIIAKYEINKHHNDHDDESIKTCTHTKTALHSKKKTTGVIQFTR